MKRLMIKVVCASEGCGTSSLTGLGIGSRLLLLSAPSNILLFRILSNRSVREQLFFFPRKYLYSDDTASLWNVVDKCYPFERTTRVAWPPLQLESNQHALVASYCFLKMV